MKCFGNICKCPVEFNDDCEVYNELGWATVAIYFLPLPFCLVMIVILAFDVRLRIRLKVFEFDTLTTSTFFCIGAMVLIFLNNAVSSLQPISDKHSKLTIRVQFTALGFLFNSLAFLDTAMSWLIVVKQSLRAEYMYLRTLRGFIMVIQLIILIVTLFYAVRKQVLELYLIMFAGMFELTKKFANR